MDASQEEHSSALKRAVERMRRAAAAKKAKQPRQTHEPHGWTTGAVQDFEEFQVRVEPETPLPPVESTVNVVPASEPDPPRPLDKPPGCDCSLPSATDILYAAVLGVAAGCLAAYLLGPRRGVALSAPVGSCPLAPYRQLSIGEVSLSSGA